MRTAAVALALTLLVAGCGSKAKGGLEVIAKRTASGTQLGAVAGTVSKPTEIQVKVEADPDVATQVSYSIDCANGKHTTMGVAPGRTPFTYAIPLPSVSADSCSVNLTASKSKSADMTVTLLARSAD